MCIAAWGSGSKNKSLYIMCRVRFICIPIVDCNTNGYGESDFHVGQVKRETVCVCVCGTTTEPPPP